MPAAQEGSRSATLRHFELVFLGGEVNQKRGGFLLVIHTATRLAMGFVRHLRRYIVTKGSSHHAWAARDRSFMSVGRWGAMVLQRRAMDA